MILNIELEEFLSKHLVWRETRLPMFDGFKLNDALTYGERPNAEEAVKLLNLQKIDYWNVIAE